MVTWCLPLQSCAWQDVTVPRVLLNHLEQGVFEHNVPFKACLSPRPEYLFCFVNLFFLVCMTHKRETHTRARTEAREIMSVWIYKSIHCVSSSKKIFGIITFICWYMFFLLSKYKSHVFCFFPSDVMSHYNMRLCNIAQFTLPRRWTKRQIIF